MLKFKKIIILGYILIFGFFIFSIIKKKTNHELQCGTAFCTSSTAKEINNLINQKVRSKRYIIIYASSRLCLKKN